MAICLEPVLRVVVLVAHSIQRVGGKRIVISEVKEDQTLTNSVIRIFTKRSSEHY